MLPIIRILTTTFPSLVTDMMKKQVGTTGWSEIVGELIGGRLGSLEFKCIGII